jgi:hypothetical protein
MLATHDVTSVRQDKRNCRRSGNKNYGAINLSHGRFQTGTGALTKPYEIDDLRTQDAGGFSLPRSTPAGKVIAVGP